MLIYKNYCMKSMKSRLDTHPDFKLKIKNKSIYMPKDIQNMMHITVRSQYILVLITYANNQLTNIKQFEIESLLDYVTIFKQNSNVLKIHLGKGVLNYFIEKSEPYINEKYVLVQKY